MVSTLDGRIDGKAFRHFIPGDEYENTGEALKGDAWVCGRTTMQQHFADGELFVSSSGTPAGPQPVHVATTAESYAISVDTFGKLRWSKPDVGGDHLICIVSEQASIDYLAMLRRKGISYVVSGKDSTDLAKAVELLAEHFGIRTLRLEGGGHINGGFLEANLVDEVSLLLAPAIDGRGNVPTVFDGLSPGKAQATQLKLKSVEQRDRGVLWIRYEVVRI
jgi:riboflavin biosynthesis pyrimidine reductase